MDLASPAVSGTSVYANGLTYIDTIRKSVIAIERPFYDRYVEDCITSVGGRVA